MTERVRIVLADGGDGDGQPVARALRDAGVEVIYVGLLSAAAIAGTAVQEDADAVGLIGSADLVAAVVSLLSGTDVPVADLSGRSDVDVMKWALSGSW